MDTNPRRWKFFLCWSIVNMVLLEISNHFVRGTASILPCSLSLSVSLVLLVGAIQGIRSNIRRDRQKRADIRALGCFAMSEGAEGPSFTVPFYCRAVRERLVPCFFCKGQENVYDPFSEDGICQTCLGEGWVIV